MCIHDRTWSYPWVAEAWSLELPRGKPNVAQHFGTPVFRKPAAEALARGWHVKKNKQNLGSQEGSRNGEQSIGVCSLKGRWWVLDIYTLQYYMTIFGMQLFSSRRFVIMWPVRMSSKVKPQLHKPEPTNYKNVQTYTKWCDHICIVSLYPVTQHATDQQDVITAAAYAGVSMHCTARYIQKDVTTSV